MQTSRIELGFTQEIRNGLVKGIDIGGCKVCQSAILDVVPHLLDGIEFRSIRRQPFQLEAWVARQDVANRGTLVHRAIIPDDDDPATEMLQQVAQERGRLHVGDVAVGIGVEVEPQALSTRREGNPGNGRDLLPVTAGYAQDERLAAWRQAAAYERIEQNAAFVDQNDVGILGSPFLRIRGQSSATQRSMRTWSRSRACFWGF